MANFEDKYKPLKLSKVVYESDKLKNIFKRMSVVPQTKAILLYGSFGTGKSTIASLLPYEIDPSIDDFAVKWIGADNLHNYNAKKHEIENHIKSGFYPFSYIIIDEFDNYPIVFQQTLKNIMDRWKGRVLFIFTTNYLSKVDPGIQSRCKKVAITHPEAIRWVTRFKEICKLEKLPSPSNQDIVTMLTNGNDGREVLEIIEDYCVKVQIAQATNMAMCPNRIKVK